jgi:hypothetical protein
MYDTVLLPMPFSPVECSLSYTGMYRVPEADRPRNRQNQKKNIRKALPILFTNSERDGAVMTGYDTGTETNHISLNLAKATVYPLTRRDVQSSSLQMGR